MSTFPSKPEILDSRTTPPRFRAAALLVIAFLVALDIAGLHMATAQLGWAAPSAILEKAPGLVYFGKWRMFTDHRPDHLAVEAQGWRDGAWAPVDLDELYPCRWVEGPGYERGAFRRDPDRVEALARHTCARTDSEIQRVRIIETTWAKTPGSVHQPRIDPQVRVLADVGCDP